MAVTIRDFDLRVEDLSTRLPFQFGAVTLTRAPLATLGLLVDVDGELSYGYSSDLLVPKWFEKNPALSLREDSARLATSAIRALRCRFRIEFEDVFGLWREIQAECVNSLPPEHPERLVHGFGVALVERGLMDAVVRASGESFHARMRRDGFGFSAGAFDPSVADVTLADLICDPADSIALRHTIGMADDLRRADRSIDRRVNDGWPETLAEDIEAYGLDHFKIKVRGEHDADLARLIDIVRVVEEAGVETPVFTLDGNEQYEDIDALARLLEALDGQIEGRRLLGALELIEQPLRRDLTFDRARHGAMDVVDAFAPLIIDEADFGVESFPAAREIGYRGCSIKNCKGVFRALVNRARVVKSGGEAFQSAEDLTNLAIWPVQQNLATVAGLGAKHVEMNGHHYFDGLAHLRAREGLEALDIHGDLYERRGDRAGLRIENGRISLTSVMASGYGSPIVPDLEARLSVDEWLRGNS